MSADHEHMRLVGAHACQDRNRDRGAFDARGVPKIKSFVFKGLGFLSKLRSGEMPLQPSQNAPCIRVR